ncbi:MAG: tetratricopeptide repeat protein [Acidobacteriaceae bacterium]
MSQTYQYRFGKDMPFLPSYASTWNGEFIKPETFPTAEYCGRCHQAIYHQWRASLHSNSFREPYYKKSVDLLKQTQGVADQRFCEACHNPVMLLSGQLTPNPVSKATTRFNNEGLTCSVCHSIVEVKPTYGVGSYVMGVPTALLDANGKPIPGEVPDKEIMAHVQRHIAAVMKPFYKSPQYCAACHEADLPTSLNHYKWLPAITLYNQWQESSYSNESPLPFYTKPHLVCQQCHMPMVKATLPDYSAKQGKVMSHRWVGGNTAVPAYYHDQTQLDLTIRHLKGVDHPVLNVDIFGLRLNGGEQWVAPIGSVPFTLKPEDTVQVAVVIQNKGIGHTLVPEQLDIIESWVQFLVTDAKGRVIMNSGGIEPSGSVDPSAHTFLTRLLDGKGHLLVHHEVWLSHTKATEYKIQSGSSTVARYQFHIPAGDPGPFTITARVNYRHFDEPFTEWVIGKHHKPLPVTIMASRTRKFYVGANRPTPPEQGDNPDWMRWNDFGISLLSQLQYGEAAGAFEQVATLRPDYDRAWANIGIAYYQWERYPEAAEYLKKALAMDPGSARTLYWQALTLRNLGQVPEAVANLEKAEKLFPLSLDIHRELGFTYYQQRKYKMADAQYKKVQSIDPDSLAAHYILAIVYRRLGEMKKAATEEATFADEKMDPMADVQIQEYYAEHPSISNEAVPWHLHTESGAMNTELSRLPKP